MQEAHRLRQSLRGKNSELDRQLSKLANTAQKNVVQSFLPARQQVEKVLNLLTQANNLSTTRARAALIDTLASSISDVSKPFSIAANMIEQLAPTLFGGTAKTPEQAGGVRMPEAPTTRRVDPGKPETFHGMSLIDNNTVEIKTSNYRGRFKITDPEITGEMVPVTSSNVHSIGFQMNLKNPLASILLVRYLQGVRGNSQVKVAGPTYGYAGVHPKLFRQFTIANSYGKFVWDELRIRGTIAGAQYRYTLLQAVGGNIPRRALLINGIQYLKRRVKQTTDGKRTVRSELNHERIGPYRPNARGASKVNRGNPDRGSQRPNRGK